MDVEPITEELFRETYGFEEDSKPPLKAIIKKKLKCSKEKALNFFPIANWIPKYDVKHDLLRDAMAGMMVAVMHIPHGLAYAPLGGVAPVVGFHMAVFPVLIYFLLGTSHHLSLGTFAVVCAMVGEVVQTRTLPAIFPDEVGNPYCNPHNNTRPNLEPIVVGVAMCFMVGVWQAALGLLHLGSLSVIMSESLVSGFTTGAACHVLTYQLKNLFGITPPSFAGDFKLIHIYINFFSQIQNTNLISLSISIICISILIFFNEYISGILRKKCPKLKFPIPIELFLILLGVTFSYFLDLSGRYAVKVVGSIPTGFPSIIVPPPFILHDVLQESLIVAIVALAVNISLARIFAKKSGHKVSCNHEFFAYGVANIVASFFQCLPSAASLSRTSIQFKVGGKTQVASLFSSSIIIMILFFAGPVFEPVPYCVLSSIVAVTLRGLLLQFLDFPRIWRQNRWDGSIWMLTFLSVIILDIGIGLVVGVVLSIFCIIFKAHSFAVTPIGRVPKTNVYLPLDHFSTSAEIPNIAILQIMGNLNYTNSERLELAIVDKFKEYSKMATIKPDYLILSFSSVTAVDPAAVTALKGSCKALASLDCEVYFTDCNISVYKSFKLCDFFKEFPKDKVLVSIHDAVEYISAKERQ